MSRVEEMLNELLKKKEEEEKENKKVLKVLAVVGIVAAVAGIAYAVYRFFAPDYLEDFEDDFDERWTRISLMRMNLRTMQIQNNEE